MPNIKLPEQEEALIGIWAQRYARHLKTNHRVLYYNLLTSCTLQDRLADVETKAESMFQSITKSLAEKENITEHLKVDDPMKWMQAMSNIRDRAREIVNNEVIFA